jgi:hypothetical protein
MVKKVFGIIGGLIIVLVLGLFLFFAVAAGYPRNCGACATPTASNCGNCVTPACGGCDTSDCATGANCDGTCPNGQNCNQASAATSTAAVAGCCCS